MICMPLLVDLVLRPVAIKKCATAQEKGIKRHQGTYLWGQAGLSYYRLPSHRKRPAAKSFAGRGCGITSAGLGTGRKKNCATTQERGIKVLQGTQLWGQGFGLPFDRLRYEARRVSPVHFCTNIDGAAAGIEIGRASCRERV